MLEVFDGSPRNFASEVIRLLARWRAAAGECTHVPECGETYLRHASAPSAVIPAKAGIHFDLAATCKRQWIPAFAGMTSKSRCDTRRIILHLPQAPRAGLRLPPQSPPRFRPVRPAVRAGRGVRLVAR